MVYYPPPSPENEWDSDYEEDGLAEQTPLDINWVQVHVYRVGLCSLPGNRFAGSRRSLVADIDTLKQAGVQDVFTLNTYSEMRRAKVITLLETYTEKGLASHHYPTENECLHLRHWLQLLRDLQLCLQSKRTAVVHCMDGLGRSCLALALLAMMLNEDLLPSAALELVQSQRGPAAIQTVKQYNFIMEFRKNLKESNEPRQPSSQNSTVV